MELFMAMVVLELFVVMVAVALMYGESRINAELKRERLLTAELSRKLHEANSLGSMAQRKLDSVVIEARKEAGRVPSRL